MEVGEAEAARPGDNQTFVLGCPLGGISRTGRARCQRQKEPRTASGIDRQPISSPPAATGSLRTCGGAGSLLGFRSSTVPLHNYSIAVRQRDDVCSVRKPPAPRYYGDDGPANDLL